MKKKHIFLTGNIQVGKSTLIKSVLSDLSEGQDFKIEYDGFITYFDQRWNEERNLCIKRFTSDKNVETEEKTVLHFEGRPIFDTLAYETVGVEVLDSLDRTKLLIFDECGRFEKECPRYIDKIKEILDEDTHVIGVLRKDPPIEWIQEIMARDDVCIFDITEENRGILRTEVKNTLLEMLGELEDDKTVV